MKTQMNRKLIDAILIAARRGREVRKQKIANNSVELGGENELLATPKRQNALISAQNDDVHIIEHRPVKGGEL